MWRAPCLPLIPGRGRGSCLPTAEQRPLVQEQPPPDELRLLAHDAQPLPSALIADDGGRRPDVVLLPCGGVPVYIHHVDGNLKLLAQPLQDRRGTAAERSGRRMEIDENGLAALDEPAYLAEAGEPVVALGWLAAA